MYRALYDHNSKLPKYLSFEAGDKFTLIDTSISDQWFLAQNGMGQIGYVPFNYIKKIDVTTEQVVKFIDGSIEAIHLTAGADGAYTPDQRVILKKLMKHRSDVIKRATLREKSPKGAGSRRRPAPAPPVERSVSVDDQHPGASDHRPANLAVVGRSATISTPTTASNTQKSPAPEPPRSKNSRDKEDVDKRAKSSLDQNSKSLHRSSVVSDTPVSSTNQSDAGDREDVRKGRSVTSSIGHAPSNSIVSSVSSLSTDADADASVSSETSGDVAHSDETKTPIVDTSSSIAPDSNIETPNSTEASCYSSSSNEMEPLKIVDSATTSSSSRDENLTGTNTNHSSAETSLSEKNVEENESESVSPTTDPTVSNVDYNQSLSEVQFVPVTNVSDLPSSSVDVGLYDAGDLEEYDLPPPPPDLQPGGDEDYDLDGGDGGGYFNSCALPPAPNDDIDDGVPTMMMRRDRDDDGDGGDVGVGGATASMGEGEGEESDESDSLDVPAFKAMRECSCDDNQAKVDTDGTFTASGSLQLPKGRKLEGKRSKKRDVDGIHAALVSSVVLTPSADPDQRGQELARLEQLQAQLGVTVTHADCEEMIGQFRHVSQLSHEESHWALLSAMGLLADNLPHIKPSLEVLAHRFKMANQCPSTGKDYQCEDTVTLEGLVGQLDSVTNDSQQRGHYLEDDLDDIIDIITTLSDTLSKAKHCVSVAAIQKDNYAMIDVIARYYQMETRWLIHSCLLQLVEAICHLHVQAITEFLYSQLPLELVAEMQQHSNDDIRFLQVARSLGIVFMRGKASPHKLTLTMDLHFFIWLLGMIEGFNERGRHDDVEMLVALVCGYHLQHRDDPQNPVTEALKMAHGHALLECALSFLSKHDDPTRLLNSGIAPKLNSVVLLLTHLYDSSDTSDLLYTNDVDALIAIFQQIFRDLSTSEYLHKQMLQLLYNFLRCYPDTASIKASVTGRLGHLLVGMHDRQGLAVRILEHNRHIFEEP